MTGCSAGGGGKKDEKQAGAGQIAVIGQKGEESRKKQLAACVRRVTKFCHFFWTKGSGVQDVCKI